ncbi:MAG TPA: hypothetical protein VIU12_33115 [Chryseolinea sp.]
METHYDQMALVWLLFFFILGVIFAPAFCFRKIAKEKGKKGLVFFVVGLFVGCAALKCGNLLVANLATRSSFQPYQDKMWMAFILPAVVIDVLAIVTFSRTIK